MFGNLFEGPEIGFEWSKFWFVRPKICFECTKFCLNVSKHVLNDQSLGWMFQNLFWMFKILFKCPKICFEWSIFSLNVQKFNLNVPHCDDQAKHLNNIFVTHKIETEFYQNTLANISSKTTIHFESLNKVILLGLAERIKGWSRCRTTLDVHWIFWMQRTQEISFS